MLNWRGMWTPERRNGTKNGEINWKASRANDTTVSEGCTYASRIPAFFCWNDLRQEYCRRFRTQRHKDPVVPRAASHTFRPALYKKERQA